MAFAQTWLYGNGVLCYIRDRQLRLLDVHHSAEHEIVVDIRTLLEEAIPASRTSRNCGFQLLHHAHGIVSCLYTHARPRARWLVVFRPSEGRVLTTRRLGSVHGVFVRNDSDFVYYGTKSGIGNDGFRRFRQWVLRGFDVKKGEWLPNNLHLPDTAGSEIGATICFEIINGYFCVLAIQTSFETVRTEYTSYYDFFRFPLDRPSHEHMEWPTKRNLFRRQNSEGPIDNRWTSMDIFSDELTGELKILESRKEWLAGNSSATRTYYTKTLRITERGQRQRASHWSDGAEDEDQYTENEPLAHFLTSSKGTNGQPPGRDPSEVHTGDDGSESVMLTLRECFIRSYSPLSHTFLDLVDTGSGPSGQRIRIRAGARLPQARHQGPQTDNDQSGVVYWPPDARSPALDSLRNVLNPPGYVGNVCGTWDGRSLMYATGGRDVKALVLVSFDPGIRLTGIQAFDERNSAADSRRLGRRLGEIQAMLGDEVSLPSRAPPGEDVATSAVSTSGSGLATEAGETAKAHAWVSHESAHCRAIGLGFSFAK